MRAHYIGAMDTIKLNMVAKDQVAPRLSDLLVSLYKVPQLPADFKGKAVAQQWLERLEKMRASDELGTTRSGSCCSTWRTRTTRSCSS